MKFFLDQDVPAEIAKVLRYWGHDVTLLKESLPLTALDQVVFQHAQDQRQIIITCNRDHYLTLAKQAIAVVGPISVHVRSTDAVAGASPP